MVSPLGLTVMATSPLGEAQLMFSTERRRGVSTVQATESEMGASREKTGEFEQVRAPKALRRFCEIVFAIEATLSPPARMRFLIARQSLLGSAALSSAAVPVTCGVAIEVPLSVE